MLKSSERKAVLSAVILPTLLSVAALAFLIGGFLQYSTTRSDALAIERQNHLVGAAVRQSIARVSTDQEASTLWDDAVVHVRERPLDRTWIDNNLGIWFYTYYHHDEIYILDDSDRPIYAMQQGERAPLQSFSRLAPEALPRIRELRQAPPSGAAADSDGDGDSTGVTDLAVIGGHPAILSIKPIVSESGKIVQAPGKEPLHVSVRYLDGSFLQRLSEDLGIQDAGFRWSAEGEGALPIRNRAGRTIGYIVWSPFEPGRQVRNQVLPVLALAILQVGALIGLLLFRIWRNRIDLEASRAKAQHLAFHDSLTGLPNRTLFDERLSEALSHSQPRRGTRLAVLLLDLDRFKNVNDTLGHQAGDALIQEFGTRLVALLPREDLLARLGGDEFAILAEVTGEGEVSMLCDRVLCAVRQPFNLLGSQAYVGASLGVAISSSSSEDPSELIRKADIALYRAKGEGRDCFRIFSSDMDASVKLRGRIEEELRTALAARRGLRVYYQPEVSPDGTVVGLEALVRWQHPVRGPIPPEQFIPIAEETGLVSALGEWVLREACRVSRRWPELFVAVNL